MQESLPARKQGNSGTMWAIAVLSAALVFCGTRLFLELQPQPAPPPHVGVITHSTPMGGKVEDGILHPSPDTSSDVGLGQI